MSERWNRVQNVPLRESTRARRRAIGSERNPLKIKGRDGSNTSLSAKQSAISEMCEKMPRVCGVLMLEGNIRILATGKG